MARYAFANGPNLATNERGPEQVAPRAASMSSTLVMPENRQQKDNRKWNSDQPQQQTSTERHVHPPFLQIAVLTAKPPEGSIVISVAPAATTPARRRNNDGTFRRLRG